MADIPSRRRNFMEELIRTGVVVALTFRKLSIRQSNGRCQSVQAREE
jgi:hypothetical protein